MDFDLNRFRLQADTVPTPDRERRTAKVRPVQSLAVPFLKGPVPMPWLECAARLPGKCLQIGVAVWYLAGIQKTTTVALGNGLLKKLGVDRKAKAHCLKALQKAGLISMEQRPGCNPRVTILELDARCET